MTDERKRMLFLALILAGSCVLVAGITLRVLYGTHIAQTRERLLTMAQSEARLMEAVARYDARFADWMRAEDPDFDASAATLSQIVDAHERYRGFGKTGEFTLATRDADMIVFQFRHGHVEVDVPEPIPLDSRLAEPMRRALSGKSGTIIGLDYRGETVVAAYEPVDVLELGIVAKIDLAEVRAPFLRAAWISAIFSCLVVSVGVVLSLRISDLMIERLESNAYDLRNEVGARKQSEESLRESEAKFRRVFESDLIGIIFWDQDGQIADANGVFLRMVGYSRDDVLSGRAGWRDMTPPEYAPADDKALAEMAEKGFCRPFETECVRKDGSRVPILLGAALLEGRSDSGVAFALDITAQKRMEGELAAHREHLEEIVQERTAELATRVGEVEQLNSAMVNLSEDLQVANATLRSTAQELAAANHELEAFAYSVSHDLRAPLRGIDGFSQALLEDCADKLDATGKDYLNRVRAASQRMGQLIDDLLMLSLVTRREMKRETVDLSELARQAAAALHEAEPERRVEFLAEEGMVAEGDAHLLEVVLQNLLGNAWKFTSSNTRARIECGVSQLEDEAVYFVRDDGAGFDMAYADKLFGAFQRLHSMAEFPGTGIGLATVQRIIHRHGGRVWAEGEVGDGATFYFTLP